MSSRDLLLTKLIYLKNRLHSCQVQYSKLQNHYCAKSVELVSILGIRVSQGDTWKKHLLRLWEKFTVLERNAKESQATQNAPKILSRA